MNDVKFPRKSSLQKFSEETDETSIHYYYTILLEPLGGANKNRKKSESSSSYRD